MVQHLTNGLICLYIQTGFFANGVTEGRACLLSSVQARVRVRVRVRVSVRARVRVRVRQDELGC